MVLSQIQGRIIVSYSKEEQPNSFGKHFEIIWKGFHTVLVTTEDLR